MSKRILLTHEIVDELEKQFGPKVRYISCHGGRFPRVNWAKVGIKANLCEAQNWRCCCCGTDLVLSGNRDFYPTIEHVIPLQFGGVDHPDNLVITCFKCNQSGIAYQIYKICNGIK